MNEDVLEDQPEGYGEWQQNDYGYNDEQQIYPSSYNIANPVPPIPASLDNHSFSYQQLYQQQQEQQILNTDPNIVPVSNVNNINNINNINIIPVSNVNNDKTYLLKHSYLSSPGRTVASCKSIWSFRSIMINTYCFIIVIMDYVILPISVLLLLISMTLMIMNQCSNKILNEYTDYNSNDNDNEITSNCQCIIDYDDNQYDYCICDGIDDHQFDVTQNGLIRLFFGALLCFLLEYISFICFFSYLLCKCLCCGNECCCKCWMNIKLNKGYYLFIIARLSGCIASCYFIHFNSKNVNCQCQYSEDINYCGPWHLDDYMQFLWSFCTFYIAFSMVFISGRMILKCLTKRWQWYQYQKLVRMVLYTK